jgi:hypothetical protein
MNSLSEIQNKPNTAPSSNGFGVLADEIVANTPAGTTIAKLVVNTNLQSSGKAVFNSIRIPEWQASYSYEVGEIFRRNGTLYCVQINHTSQANTEDFYLDWFVNNRVLALNETPGTIQHSLRVDPLQPGAYVIPADGSEYNISDKPDLYRYLYYGSSFTLLNISNVIPSGGFAQFVATGHGLETGDIVNIKKGAGGGSWPYDSVQLYAIKIDANNFRVSASSAGDKYTDTSLIISYSGTHFTVPSQATSQRYLWGLPTSPTKFRVPDLRSMFLSGAGSNGAVLRYNKIAYSRLFGGNYEYDRGLTHRHLYYPDNPNYVSGQGGGGSQASNNQNSQHVTDYTLEARANETEFTPVHVVVNYYIKY